MSSSIGFDCKTGPLFIGLVLVIGLRLVFGIGIPAVVIISGLRTEGMGG